MATKNSAAVLLIKVEFDEIPSKNEINEIIDTANSTGAVTDATLEIMTPAKIDVTGGWN